MRAGVRRDAAPYRGEGMLEETVGRKFVVITRDCAAQLADTSILHFIRGRGLEETRLHLVLSHRETL